MGVAHEKGRGIEQDFFQAVKLFKKACDGEMTVGCIHLGVMYYSARSVKQDNAKQLFVKARDTKVQKGCKYSAILTHKGY